MSRRHSAFDVGIAAAETIARRMPIIWWNAVSPTRSSKAEVAAMVAEKQKAATDGALAMQAEMLKLAFSPWWLLTNKSAWRAMQRVADAGAAPASVRAKSNAKRLRGAALAPRKRR